MCGRYSQASDIERLLARFLLAPPGFPLAARYNIAPTQEAPVVVFEAARELVLCRWGLIPSWAKDAAIGARMINARAETILEKPSFKRPFQRTRCLVLADGFYEWKKEGDGKKKTPMRIRLRSREPFAFAGLWDSWRSPEGKVIRSFTIITTEANEALRPIHDRMPVILKPEEESAWLDPRSNPLQMAGLLGPYPAQEMEAYEVSTLVNSPRNDAPECITPAAEPK